jgi:hypothetical protein
LKFGVLTERPNGERVQLQVLKTFREENDKVRELLRASSVRQNAAAGFSLLISEH